LAGLLLNVPYGSPFLPQAVARRLSLTAEEVRWENWNLTDPFLLDLIKRAVSPDPPPPEASGSPDLVRPAQRSLHKLPECLLVSYPYSPLVADPLGLVARELGQIDSPAPAILTRGTQEKDLPQWTASEQAFLRERCIQPYLDELAAGVRKLLDSENLAVLVNIRFFSLKPWLHEPRGRIPLPQISLGLSDEQTPKGLVHLIGHIFRTFGLWTELDYPQAGTAVPRTLAGRPRLKVLGLGLRRDLYLDETKAEFKTSLQSLVRILRTLFCLMGQELDRVAQVRIRRAFPPKPPSSIIKAAKAGPDLK
jgi:hypothetical protein